MALCLSRICLAVAESTQICSAHTTLPLRLDRLGRCRLLSSSDLRSEDFGNVCCFTPRRLTGTIHPSPARLPVQLRQINPCDKAPWPQGRSAKLRIWLRKRPGYRRRALPARRSLTPILKDARVKKLVLPIAALAFAAACEEIATAPELAPDGVRLGQVPLPIDGSSQACPDTSTGDPIWIKIDRTLGAASGAFGSFSYAGSFLSYKLNDGYVLQFCVQSGEQDGTIYREVTGTSSIKIAQAISHTAWRIVHTPPTAELQDLSISNGTAGSYDRTVDSALSKKINGQPTVPFTGIPGQELHVAWKAEATESEALSGYSVVGDITITNPNTIPVKVGVEDMLDDMTVAVVDCDASTGGAQATGTVPANGSLICGYVASPSGRTATVSTATVTVDSYDPPVSSMGTIRGGKATAAVPFTGRLFGDEVTPGDVRFNHSARISSTTAVTLPKRATCSPSAKEYMNGMCVKQRVSTATLVGDKANLSASSIVNVRVKAW